MRSEDPDFTRQVHCVLGLPFDAISEEAAADAIRRAAAARKRCWLSTPNLNFTVACLTDAKFRDSVLQSDLSIADGWPVVLAARVVGAALPERATGSGVFERLCGQTGDLPLSVFFFGGPEGAAAAACARVSNQARGVVCCGYASPGFGSVTELSRPQLLAQINDSGAQFLVVALGARKGQQWIHCNVAALATPVIAHLGAVMNFTAGTVRRAPRALQRMHLEWLWRIKEEPALWRRYASDGAALLRLMATRLLPLALRRLAARPARMVPTLVTTQGKDRAGLELVGNWSGDDLLPLRSELQRLVATGRPVAVDLRRATAVGSATLGLLLLLHGWHRRHGLDWTVCEAGPALRQHLRHCAADYLFAAKDAR